MLITKGKEMSKIKKCTKCYKFKTLDLFRIDKNCKDGHTNECKECRYNYMIIWRKNNQASRRASSRKFEQGLKNGEYPHRIQAKRLRVGNYQVIKAIRISKMLKTDLTVQEKTFKKLFGCSSKVFIARFEREFEKNPGMGWHNYGAWQMDHIKPMREFTLDTEASRKLCNHYTNLRPEWGTANMRKSSSYAVEQKI